MPYATMLDLPLKNKRVLIREDFNVPLKDGVIQDDTRIRAAIPTLEYALVQGAAVIVLSHLGRPEEGSMPTLDTSLQPIATRLSALMGKPVRFEPHWIDGITVTPGEIVLCENTRLLPGEKKCAEALSQKMAALCDVFVMDAFATAHRAEASTAGVAKFAKEKCAGLLLDAELTALSKTLSHPAKPLAAIVGGSKVSTKMTVLSALLEKVDVLIVGGGIANTFLAAKGYDTGCSLIEKDWIEEAKKLLEKAAQKGVQMPLPCDVRTAKQFSAEEEAVIKSVDQVAADDMILDIGPKTAGLYADILKQAKTIVWNGPVGVFEFPAFAEGTKAMGAAIAASEAFSIAGGGDTLAAVAQFQLEKHISYLSTGGGAFLEWMEGKTLPGVEILT